MENAANLNDSAIALTEADRPFEAVPLFMRALILEPENPLIWFNLGVAQQKLGDYNEALGSYQKAVFFDGEFSDAWGSMGLIYYEQRQFESSEECYKTALSRNSRSPKVWNNLGVLYFSRNNFTEARNCFEEALVLLPSYYDALFNMRDCCRELGDNKAAAEFDRHLSALNPPKS